MILKAVSAIQRDAEYRLKPGLAVSWRAVDPTTWEFKLRQGVKFHNGEPFNAQAVKFSLDLALDPITKWPGAGPVRLIQVRGGCQYDTVRITTERPWPNLPRFMPYYRGLSRHNTSQLMVRKRLHGDRSALALIGS